MKVAFSNTGKSAVLTALKNTFSTGVGQAKFVVYSGVAPASVNDPITSQTSLIEIPITPEDWTINATGLVIPASTGETLADNTGIARWARWFNKDNVAVMDTDVSSLNGNGFVKLKTTVIVAGTPCSSEEGLIGIGE